ncbi:MAG: hypothetical protein ABIP67_01455 [Burkholderiales bacterium]
MRNIKIFWACLFCFSLCGSAAWATPTNIVIRILAKDAKFVGTDMGGVEITLRDAVSGEVLAQGLTEGATGSTPVIMKDGNARREILSDAKSAKFSVTLDLDRPRQIMVTATGPNTPKKSATTVSSTQWVIPGKSIDGGDGWVLELPGFVVTALNPVTEIDLSATRRIPIRVKVTMMCGCPITPNGQWDANKFEIVAMLAQGGKNLQTVSLPYAGKPSEFGGDIDITGKGQYEMTIYAYDPANGNTGLDRFTVTVR